MLMAFFAGCLLFYLNGHVGRLSSKTKRIILTSLVLYSALVTALIIKAGYPAVFGHWDRVMPLMIYPLCILLLLNIALIEKFFSLRPFTFIGDLSYSIYLLHFPVQLLMFTFLPMAGVQLDYTRGSSLLIYAALTTSLAAASHYLFEKPVQRMIREKYVTGA
jgi:peptidoglycan/LPS O-acetylase OafA/YrhL